MQVTATRGRLLKMKETNRGPVPDWSLRTESLRTERLGIEGHTGRDLCIAGDRPRPCTYSQTKARHLHDFRHSLMIHTGNPFETRTLPRSSSSTA